MTAQILPLYKVEIRIHLINLLAAYSANSAKAAVGKEDFAFARKRQVAEAGIKSN
jgi:hypothetical protein